MSVITNQPRDDDALIESKKGPLGNTYFVATPLFIHFLNDLVSAVEQAPQDTSPEFRTAITRLKAVANEANQYVSSVHQEVAELRARLAKQQARFDELETKVQNMEQITWR